MHALSNYNDSGILIATPESDLSADQQSLNANFKTIVTGYVPYTGATGNVNLGTYDLGAATVECNTLGATSSPVANAHVENLYLSYSGTDYLAGSVLIVCCYSILP
jgi:hypothetical protein